MASFRPQALVMVDLQPGTRFAHFTIGRRIAVGKVGVLFEAETPEGDRRAIKLLKEDAALTSVVQARLAQECRILAAIDHVNVVRFFDAGVDGGRVWLLLELVRGKDLRRRVQDARGALPVELAVRLIRQACQGMAVAHALKVVHRDLCPDNILVTDDDIAKVADFGSARAAYFSVVTTQTFDISDGRYWAPERIVHQRVGEKTDVYALALTLYEILAGANPMVVDTRSDHEVFLRQIQVDPPPLATVRRDVGSDLSDLLAWALAKDDERRCSLPEFDERLGVVHHRLQVSRRVVAFNLPVPALHRDLAATEPSMPAIDWPAAPGPGRRW